MAQDELEAFIVEAKAASYVGGGRPLASTRSGSHDVGWARDSWRYLDSYFGGSDFSGQEVVWLDDQPVWAMSYHGFILDGRLIDASRAGAVIKDALSQLYQSEGRFLGGYRHVHAFGTYVDENEGAVDRFRGNERIEVGGRTAYALFYHGGRITP